MLIFYSKSGPLNPFLFLIVPFSIIKAYLRSCERNSYPLLEVHNLVSRNIKSGITVIGPGNYARVEKRMPGESEER